MMKNFFLKLFKNAAPESSGKELGKEPSAALEVSPYWRTGDIRIKIDKAAVKHFERYRFTVEKLRELGCMKICDIACGSGYGSWILSGSGNTVAGVDIEEEVIEYAKRTYQNERLTFHVGDVTDIKMPANSFGAVVSFETVEHVVNPGKAILECRKILKPGGYYIFSIPINHPDTVYHKKIYSLKDAKSLIESFDWDNVDYYYQELDTPFISESCETITTLLGICRKSN